MTCNRCHGSGFLNADQLPHYAVDYGHEQILLWIRSHIGHDVQVCDCCGDGATWHSDPGEHSPADFGPGGPYGYNGGLPECS